MSKITKVEVGRYDYGFIGEFKFFKPDPDGKVRRPSVLVRLTDEDGYQGWGQAVPTPSWTYETPESVETTIANYLTEALLGVDPADLEEVHQRMNHTIRPACSIGQPLAKAAIDIACYDLVGKRSRQPVSTLLGGAQRETMQLSWTVNATEMAVVEEQLDEGLQQSYRNFNFKVGPPQTPQFDLALAKKIYEFAPQGFLWADANTGYSVRAALDILPKLADIGVAVIESPLPPHQIRGYQALKQQGALPIFMDEGIILDDMLAEFIALDMLDGVTVKTARSAGIWQSRKIIQLAKEKGKKLLGSGLTDPDLSLAASLHLFAWAGIDKPCALNGPQYLDKSLITRGLDQQGDLIDVPDGSGLGVEMNAAAEAYLAVAGEI
ncbi:MAG: enolase C-terminal domain-like protein [Anaerolineales bacterium]